MLKISKSALDKLKNMLEQEDPIKSGIRVGVRGSGECALSYYLGIQKKAMEGDSVISYDGIDVFIDKLSLEKLAEIELDYLENPIKSGFIFRDIKSNEQGKSIKCKC